MLDLLSFHLSDLVVHDMEDILMLSCLVENRIIQLGRVIEELLDPRRLLL